MTIQIPVLLWTIICFVALAFILNKLLFKPFFRVMDARRERLDSAQAEKTAREEAAAAALEEARRLREENEKEAEVRRTEALRSAREDARTREAEAVKAQQEELEQYRQKMETERQAMLEALLSHTGELTDMISARLLK